MTTMLKKQPPFFTVQKGSCLPQDLEDYGDNCSSTDYYSDSPLPQRSHGNGIMHNNIVHTGPI